MIAGKKLFTVIRAFGGKFGMMNKIKEYFPKEETYKIYIEPFANSFSIGLTMKTPILIYNDLDRNVYSLYKVISDKELFYKFKEKCDLTYYSEDLRKEFKLKLKEELSIIDRAFYFFYVNRSSHNGQGGFSINSSIRRTMSKSISDYLSAIDRLPELHDKLSKVIITNKDGIDLFKRYDNKEVFFYSDSPYAQSTRGTARYAVDMDDVDQERYIDTLLNLKNAKVLVSAYECDLYNKLEKVGWNKYQFEVKTTDGKRQPKIKTETLYSNY